jgi:hypothetical protein
MSIIINKDSDYKNETISSIPLGINNLKIDSNEKNFDLKKDEINNNIKPMLSSGSNTITIQNGKKYKVKPNFNKKVPMSTFSMIANKKKNMGSSGSDDEVSASEDTTASDSVTDEILSGKSSSNNKNSNTQSSYDSEEEEDDDDYSSIESGSQNRTTQSGTEYTEEEDDDEETVTSEPKKKSYEEIQQEKQDMLFKLDRLTKQGYPPSKRYSMASAYEDIKYEHDRLKKQRDVEKSIRFSRKMLMAFASGTEWLNTKFDYFDIKLEGWSENVMENISDYDEVFEELHDKYSESVKMAPELKLLSMVAGSAFMFHITNSIFKSASPKLSDILKQNPDIMRNISEAAAKNMGNTINQQFGETDFVGNMMKEGINMKMNQQRGPIGQSSSRQTFQPKMSGPVGIDELLDELNSGNGTDNVSISSEESVKMSTSNKRTVGGRKGGLQLNI